MKKNRYFIILCAVIIIACTQNEKKQVNADELPIDPLTIIDTASFALDMDSAILYAAHYDSVAKKALGQPAPIKAYTVRATDLLEVLGISKKTKTKYQFVRVYLGFDFNNKFRLFLTPAEGADIRTGHGGRDIVLHGLHTHGLADSVSVTREGEYMLDFTAPCPNSCPSNSKIIPPPSSK